MRAQNQRTATADYSNSRKSRNSSSRYAHRFLLVLSLTRTGSLTSPRARSRAHSASQAFKYSNCTAGSPALPPLTNSPNHAFSTPTSAHSSSDDAYHASLWHAPTLSKSVPFFLSHCGPHLPPAYAIPSIPRGPRRSYARETPFLLATFKS